MTNRRVVLGIVAVLYALRLDGWIGYSQEKAAPTGVQVHMVIADQALRDDSEIPALRPNNIQVKQGKSVLKVNQLIPARGDNATLQLFILIDDTCDQSIGNNLNDIRDFVNAQPATTVVGIAYMSNATIQILQNFTADHALAAKAIRLPRGTLSSMGSPYLSLISLVKGWPAQKVRREVLMVTDGIDRLRGERPSAAQLPSNYSTRSRGVPSGGSIGSSAGMATISVDADSASMTSQRSGVIVHSIYATGVGRVGSLRPETYLCRQLLGHRINSCNENGDDDVVG